MTGDIQPEQQSTLGQAMVAQFAAIAESANATVESLYGLTGVGKELEHLAAGASQVADAWARIPDHSRWMQRLDLATRAVIVSMGLMQQKQDEAARFNEPKSQSSPGPAIGDTRQQPVTVVTETRPEQPTGPKADDADPLKAVEELARKLPEPSTPPPEKPPAGPALMGAAFPEPDPSRNVQVTPPAEPRESTSVPPQTAGPIFQPTPNVVVEGPRPEAPAPSGDPVGLAFGNITPAAQPALPSVPEPVVRQGESAEGDSRRPGVAGQAFSVDVTPPASPPVERPEATGPLFPATPNLVVEAPRPEVPVAPPGPVAPIFQPLPQPATATPRPETPIAPGEPAGPVFQQATPNVVIEAPRPEVPAPSGDPIGLAFGPIAPAPPVEEPRPESTVAPAGPVGQAFQQPPAALDRAPAESPLPVPATRPDAEPTPLQSARRSARIDLSPLPEPAETPSPLPSARRSAKIDLPDEPATPVETPPPSPRQSARRSAKIDLSDEPALPSQTPPPSPLPSARRSAKIDLTDEPAIPPPVKTPSPLPSARRSARIDLSDEPPVTASGSSGSTGGVMRPPNDPPNDPPKENVSTTGKDRSTEGLGRPNFLAPVREKAEAAFRPPDTSSFGDKLSGMWQEIGGDEVQRRMRLFSLNVMDAGRGVGAFAREIIPIPATLAGFVKQSMSAGSPQAMSTLSKSWQLVIGQMTSAFMPVIATVIMRLQDFAGWLKSSGSDNTAAKAGILAGIAAWFVPGGPIVKALAAGLMGLGSLYLQLKQNEKKNEGMRKDIKTDEAYTEKGHEVIGIHKEIMRGKHGEALKKQFTDNNDKIDLSKVSEMPQQMQDALKKAGLSEKFEEFEKLARDKDKRDESKPGAGKDGKGATGYMADHPPGYQAQYQQIADIRKNAQVSALGKSPLDMALEKLQLQNYYDMLKRIADNTSKEKRDLPAGKGGGAV